jgi:ABC-type transport system involved in multi-copper enzyme maturation permease subunit
MIIGPIFTREAATVPRRPRLYVARFVYVSALLILMFTAWLVITGTQVVRNLGDMARFGATLFQLLAPLQLALVTFLSSLVVASGVAQEKDRRTLVLLLMTRISNHELVFGKLFAGLLGILVMLLAAVPVFLSLTLFGGVSHAQVFRVLVVTLMTAITSGSLGAMIAFSREKTFQTLALTCLILLIWVSTWEAVHFGVLGTTILGWEAVDWAQAFSPLRAILAAATPTLEQGTVADLVENIGTYLLGSLVLATLINGWSIYRIRVWNPSREARPGQQEEEGPQVTAATVFSSESLEDVQSNLEPRTGSPASDDGTRPAAHAEAGPSVVTATKGSGTLGKAESRRAGHVDARVRQASQKSRAVWDNPILWREVCTWAYGRKVILIRAVYLVLFLMAAITVQQIIDAQTGRPRNEAIGTVIPAEARPLAPFFLISLVIINALAVTSITNERDGQALDLLLVTDLTSKEFVFGKLLGIAWVTKEMILLPLGLIIYMWWQGGLGSEPLLFLGAGLLIMDVFVAMLGVHCGMTYANSRSAIGVSLGTVFFLFLGVVTCIALMVSFSGSFQTQLAPFAAFILGGSVGLYLTLGVRNPSNAIAMASLLLPFCTFNAITSFLLGHLLSVFIWTSAIYGFTIAAMMMPAIGEFDIAMGRTKAAGDE